MTTVNCAISGIQIQVPHFNTLTLPHTSGYTHPIFLASRRSLESLYLSYLHNKLTNIESYLLFLAYLNKTNQITWRHHATRDPESLDTIALISKSLTKLVGVMEKTRVITAADFSQPSYVISKDNSLLAEVPIYIAAWNSNIYSYLNDKQDLKAHEELKKVTNALTLAIKSCATLPNYTELVAEWASKAASFPPESNEAYKRIIINAFSPVKMFSTPIEIIKEVKSYCEENIEVGTIHFHELMKALNSASQSNISFLGGEDLGLKRPAKHNPTEFFKLKLPENPKLAKPVVTEPTKADFPNTLDYLKAKLAYNNYKQSVKQSTNPDNI